MLNPVGLPNTIAATFSGATPAFADLASYDLAPAAGSPLLENGNGLPVSPTGYVIANPLFPLTMLPPRRVLLAVGTAAPRIPNGNIDIGAFELVDTTTLFSNGFE